jgi:hypothetical protein
MIQEKASFTIRFFQPENRILSQEQSQEQRQMRKSADAAYCGLLHFHRSTLQGFERTTGKEMYLQK